ncbi:DUF5053 domain-containing protein [Bacteroides acidifaciens]|nr:DUF5053 domain-containing protein [Bacteroides acidifaciens]
MNNPNLLYIIDLREKIQELVDKMSESNITPNGRKVVDDYFAELNKILTPEEKREGGKIMRELLAKNREFRRVKRTDINIKEKLIEIQDIISLSYIAKYYFGKDKSWIYQRINGTCVNGKPAAFTNEELDILSNALKDIGTKISDTSL